MSWQTQCEDSSHHYIAALLSMTFRFEDGRHRAGYPSVLGSFVASATSIP